MEEEGASAGQTLRMHYEQAITEMIPPTNENKHDFELLEAARAGDDDKIREVILKTLNEVDGKCKFQGRTALHLAAQGGHANLAKILLEKGSNMQQKSSSGETAFFMAIKEGHTAVVHILLENGASVHEKSNPKTGMSPLCMAVRYRHTDVVKLLIDHGSIPEIVTSYSHALIEAITSEQEEIVVLLLKNGTNVNQRSRRKYAAFNTATALHAAVGVGPHMTKLILDAQGDLEAGSGQGLTPLSKSLASSCRINIEVVKLLVDAGAKISPKDWVRFTPELRQQYAHRCPLPQLNPAAPSFEDMVYIDKALDNVEEWNIDEDMEYEACRRDNMQHSQFDPPPRLGTSERDIELGSDREEQTDEHFQ